MFLLVSVRHVGAHADGHQKGSVWSYINLQSQTKIVGTLRPNAVVFFSSCSPCPSQSCLLRFSHQTLYTNIEGTRRHKSVPTILTETVDKSSVLSLQLYKGDIVISISIRFFPYSKSFFVNFLQASRKKPQIKISVKLTKTSVSLGARFYVKLASKFENKA